ncbi:MAG TPA: hypothetical protein VFR88_01895, partial [Microlunatus sp.]|nr:hypothetical protein [Microlunatus sp.]
PHQPDRKAAAQLATLGLVPDTAVQPGSQHMELGFSHRALESQGEPVVEQCGVVDAVGVGQQGIGQPGQIEQ